MVIIFAQSKVTVSITLDDDENNLVVQISQFYTDKHTFTTYLIYLFTLIIYLNLQFIVYLHINKRSFFDLV